MKRTIKSISSIWLRLRFFASDLAGDCRGVVAVEFAMIAPLMLVLFFGTVEIGSGVAVYRKITLVSRTLSDLTSQSSYVLTSDQTNFFCASDAILYPYSYGSTSAGNPVPTSATVSELYVDPTTLQARVQWSTSATITMVSGGCNATLGAGRTVSSVVAIPSQLATGGTYLILSEVSFLYQPSVGYVLSSAGVNVSDTAYTRPRQTSCVFLNPAVIPVPNGTPCPTL
jgi:Flp pilus assembly protein TadG